MLITALTSTVIDPYSYSEGVTVDDTCAYTAYLLLLAYPSSFEPNPGSPVSCGCEFRFQNVPLLPVNRAQAVPKGDDSPKMPETVASTGSPHSCFTMLCQVEAIWPSLVSQR